jgi:glucokinase
LKSGAVARDGRFLLEAVQPTGANEGAEELLEALSAQVARISEQIGRKPRAIALALPGAIHPQSGIVLLPGRLKGMENFPIVPRLQERSGVPTVADNDGRISMIAEKQFGLARDKKWALSITLGTGVGSGVMLDGHILRDPHLQFGTQAGHIVMQPHGGHLCLTGARGTAEMSCSALALAESVRNGLARGIPSVLSDRFFADSNAIDFEAVIEGVAQNDRLCADELKLWTEKVGWFLVSAAHAYAPEIIILSGGAVNAARYFLEELQAHLNAHIFRYPVGEPLPIAISQMGDRAGVLGAGAVAWQLAGE